MSLLKKLSLQPVVKDITKEPPSMDELYKMLSFQNGNIKKLFNTSGQLYKHMQIAASLSSMSLEEALSLLSCHGMLVKRPFLLADHLGLTGFSEPQWLQKLSMSRQERS